MFKHIYRISRSIFNNLFKFKYLDLKEEDKYLVFKETKKYNVDLSKLDIRWRDKFDFVNNWEQEAYIMHYPNVCYIEPIFGYAINKDKKYLLHTKAGSWGFLFGSNNDKTPPPDRFVFMLKRRKAIKLGKAISLNSHANFGKNYWAAYNHVLGQLCLLKRNGIDLQLPIIIPKSMFETTFFQQIIKLNQTLQELKWIVRDDINYDFKHAQYYECSELYTAKAISYCKEYLIHPLSLFDNINSNEKDSINRKIFLTRSNKRARHIRNNEEIEKIISSYGFEIIDTDNMTVKEQILLFRNVSMMIALHGAGNINMIFRYPKQLKFLELNTISYIPSSYMIIAQQFGYDYDLFFGSELDGGAHSRSSFYIDPTDLKNKLEEWIKIKQ